VSATVVAVGFAIAAPIWMLTEKMPHKCNEQQTLPLPHWHCHNATADSDYEMIA